MKFHLFVVILSLFSSINFAQDSTSVELPDNDSDSLNTNSIVFALGLNSNSVEKFYCLGSDLDIQYRFDNNRQRVGLGFETMFSLNKKRYDALQSEFFTGDINEVTVGMRYSTLAWKLEYNYYLIDPMKSRFTTRVGANCGLALQMQSSDYFSTNKLIGNQFVDKEEVGFIAGGLFGVEYAFRKTSLYAEVGVSYHYVNKEIEIIEKRHQLGGAIKCGVLFNVSNELFYRLLRLAMRPSYF